MHTTLTHATATAHHGSLQRRESHVSKILHSQDFMITLGRIASALSVVMYVSYIPQIANNLAGHPGTPFQPLAAFFNCVLWTVYGLLKKDRPIVIANVPGIVLAGVTFVTALLHG